MSRSRSITFLTAATALVLAASTVAGCGSRGGSNASSSPALPQTPNGQSATIGVATGVLGQILVDSQGRTLYLFKKDSGTTSMCTGACATFWPPLRATGKPTASSGATASMLATTNRSDGGTQITYNGHPLYLYSGDTKPGDTEGEGLNTFGGLWYVLSSSGDEITAPASSGAGYGH